MEPPQNFSRRAAANLSTRQLREEFIVSGLFTAGEARFRIWETDRTVLGGIEPTDDPIELANLVELRSSFFLERREAGVINLAGPGIVRVDETEYRLETLDALYLGRGAKSVSFASVNSAALPRFWLQSYPAHASHPTRHVAFSQTPGEQLGGPEGANSRTLTKLIHPGAFPTCQLVMGVTRMAKGNVWNTMPPHTHLRRSEVYLYFNLRAGDAVFHFMGEPDETRHLVVHNNEAVLSPPWSIHCGVGMSSYAFVWGMGGENQEFADMDRIDPLHLR